MGQRCQTLVFHLRRTWNSSVELLRFFIWRNSSIRHTPWERLRFACAAREAEAFGTWRKPCSIYSAFMCSSSESLVLYARILTIIGRAWTLSSVKNLNLRVTQSLFDMCVILCEFHMHGTSYFFPCSWLQNYLSFSSKVSDWSEESGFSNPWIVSSYDLYLARLTSGVYRK